ncbi:MAG: prepilin-type N-terminal cleavage/methylation domain-containing protein [Acidobacteriota bacterium]|nr:prepilin-type N-terminal cleavage/methylation domain-containing protein [Acidobacteriota bacterium]
MRQPNFNGNNAAGFSLIELMIAMGTTLVVMGIATTLLASSFNVRARENRRSDGLADVQRALNIMTREIANSGFNLINNGVVGCAGGACDSDGVSIRIRANLNRYTESNTDVLQPGEDLKYFLQPSADGLTVYLARYDANNAGVKATVLANRVDALQFHYFDERVNYTTGTYNSATPTASLLQNVTNSAGNVENEVSPNLAAYIVIVLCVQLDAVGTPGSPGYQPSSSVLLASDVALRNELASDYKY